MEPPPPPKGGPAKIEAKIEGAHPADTTKADILSIIRDPTRNEQRETRNEKRP